MSCCLLVAGHAYGRDFTVRTLSEPGQDARHPSIGDTGLVAWQGYLDQDDGVATSRRSDIFVFRDGTITNATGMAPQLSNRNERPQVIGESVLFTAVFKPKTGGGFPFELSIPSKSDNMRELESDYPTLFDPPGSAVEADAAELDAPSEPAPPPGAADDAASKEASMQHQMWRSSGGSFDIAHLRPDNTLERITPGTRHFSTPVMSTAGMAFQVARGWPYGYEILSWKPGDNALTQLSTNYYYALGPHIHGNELVFQAWDGHDYEIYHYRFDTGEIKQLTNNQFDDTHPVVWDGEVAWIAHPTINAEIFHYRDGVIRKISDTSQDNGPPSIWQGRVVWQGYDDTDLEIYYFDGRRTIKLTSNTWDDVNPVIRDGLIVWMSYVDNSDAEIMALDLGDNITVQLTNDDWEDSGPRTAGEKVVWYTLTPEGAKVQIAEPDAPRPEAIP
ncbi:MAG: hypothetical protein RBT03_03170 [Kiritimatiellia bacterium]|jgi:hypothetical protein|nr:hypothetical protein [Kiritimatiellia bacterium]